MIRRATPLAGIEVIADKIRMILTAVWTFQLRALIPQVIVHGLAYVAPYVMNLW